MEAKCNVAARWKRLRGGCGRRSSGEDEWLMAARSTQADLGEEAEGACGGGEGGEGGGREARPDEAPAEATAKPTTARPAQNHH